MRLKLKHEIAQKDCIKFAVANEIELKDFHACQYMLPICGIQKFDNGKYYYNTNYGDFYIKEKISPNQFISFAEQYKENIVKEKDYSEGHFTTVYYLLYTIDEKPTLLNNYCYFNKNRVDVEIVFNENGYYRVDEVHLELPPHSSLINAIKQLFSNENISGLSFIKQTDDNQYSIIYYNEYGREMEQKYSSLDRIYEVITSIRLVGCKEISNF